MIKYDLYYFNNNINEYSFDQLRILFIGLKEGVDISNYSNPEYDSVQMEEIFLGLIARIDVSVYSHTCFSGPQMEQIRIGILNGIDVSIYCDPSIQDRTMKRYRVYQERKFRYSKIHVNEIKQVESYNEEDEMVKRRDELLNRFREEYPTVFREFNEDFNSFLE